MQRAVTPTQPKVTIIPLNLTAAKNLRRIVRTYSSTSQRGCLCNSQRQAASTQSPPSIQKPDLYLMFPARQGRAGCSSACQQVTPATTFAQTKVIQPSAFGAILRRIEQRHDYRLPIVAGCDLLILDRFPANGGQVRVTESPLRGLLGSGIRRGAPDG